ncbi:MAG: domain S-box protein, partial [Geminicoccaceae bacterium]|nr:domain S-box protein [Geminicoccaceae bacterium]
MHGAPDLTAYRNATAFLTGGGAMGALARAHDWAATPLGSPNDWPPSLRTAVGMVLNSRFPAALVWGRGLVTIYNDAFRPILGQKPEALGRSFADVWSEAWAEIGPIAERAFRGEATYVEDFPLVVERNGYPEQAYFTFCYSPVRDEAGEVVGFLDTVIETTKRIRAEAALSASEGRLRFLSELDEALRASGDAPAAMEAAARLLARRLGSSRCAYADVDADTDRFIIRSDHTAPGITTSVGTYSLDLFGPRAAADMRSGRTLVVRDVSGELAPEDGAEMFQRIGIRAIVCCPLVKEGRLVAMMAVHQDRPHDWRDEEISLVEAVVERCWAHIERVGAEARLRESEGKFEAIANSIDQMIWSTRPDGYHDYYNDRWYEYTGVPDGSTDGEAWNGVFHPDDQERAWRVWRHSLETGAPYHIEYRLRHRSGHYRWVIGRAQCVRDNAGRISRWYGTCTDVHDLKVAEERLRELNDTLERRVAERTGELAESQRRFRGIFDSALQFMALLTPA